MVEEGDDGNNTNSGSTQSRTTEHAALKLKLFFSHIMLARELSRTSP